MMQGQFNYPGKGITRSCLTGNQNSIDCYRDWLLHIQQIAKDSIVVDATGMQQRKISRFKRDLEKAGRLWETEKTLCKQTSFKAWYLLTNRRNIICSNQLNLF